MISCRANCETLLAFTSYAAASAAPPWLSQRPLSQIVLLAIDSPTLARSAAGDLEKAAAGRLSQPSYITLRTYTSVSHCPIGDQLRGMWPSSSLPLFCTHGCGSRAWAEGTIMRLPEHAERWEDGGSGRPSSRYVTITIGTWAKLDDYLAGQVIDSNASMSVGWA